MKRSTLGWSEIILGILMILLGIYTMMNPNTAIVGIVIVYAVVAILTGIADFVGYSRVKAIGLGGGMLLVSGILNVVVGVLLMFNIGAGVWTLSILFPIWFIMHCVARLMNIGFVRQFGSNFDYWVALIANVVGVVLGIVLLLFNPILSVLTLVYFVAAYLLIVGISSLMGGIGNLGARM